MAAEMVPINNMPEAPTLSSADKDMDEHSFPLAPYLCEEDRETFAKQTALVKNPISIRKDLLSVAQAKTFVVNQLDDFIHNCNVIAEYIYHYNITIHTRKVFPSVKPGFMRSKFSDHAPDRSTWNIAYFMSKFDRYVMPGVCHWKHPYFFAYFPAGGAYGNILGDMLSTACGGVGFTWAAQPSLTELEIVMMDWLGKALNLPNHFLYGNTKGLQGGGMTTGSASESIHYALLGARHKYMLRLGADGGNSKTKLKRGEALQKMVAYTSIESHSSVPKAAQVALVNMHLLVPDNLEDKITGTIFLNAINQDHAKGLIPFFMCASVGSTGGCAVDDVETIGKICFHKDIYFHVDAAYAGSSFISQKFAYLRNGLEYADSLDVNPYKFLLGAPDLACLWVRNLKEYKRAFVGTKQLNDIDNQPYVVNFRSLGIPVTRRMRALKLWLLFQNYGRIGLQRYVERLVECAKYFEKLVHTDTRFEVMNKVHLALVCFRQVPVPQNRSGPEPVKTLDDKKNINLTNRLNNSEKMHLVGTYLRQKYCLRFSVNYEFCTHEHMDVAWQVIRDNYVTKLDGDFTRSIQSEVDGVLRQTNSYMISPEHHQHLLDTNSLRADGFGRIPVIKDEDTTAIFAYFGKQLAERIEAAEQAMLAADSDADKSEPSGPGKQKKNTKKVDRKYTAGFIAETVDGDDDNCYDDED